MGTKDGGRRFAFPPYNCYLHLHAQRRFSGKRKNRVSGDKGRRAVAGQGRRMTGFGGPVAASPWPGRVDSRVSHILGFTRQLGKGTIRYVQGFPSRPLLGYARMSTQGQDLAQQRALLREAGCTRIFEEKISGAKRNRPELERLLDHLRAGDGDNDNTP